MAQLGALRRQAPLTIDLARLRPTALLFLLWAAIGIELTVLAAWLPDTMRVWLHPDTAGYGDFPSFYQNARGIHLNATYSPDGIPNYLLRYAPTYIAGKNSNDPAMIDLNSPLSIGRGQSVTAMGDLPSMKMHEWNMALEKQMRESFVIRVRYTGRHGYHADQTNNINPQQTNYVWLVSTGQPFPTGTYSGEARRPYDQTAYTDVRVFSKTGFINSTTFVVEAEKRFSKGLSFQIFHTMTNAFRLAGNSTRDGIGNNIADYYIPNSVPTDFDTLNRLVNYARDTAIPKHRTRWNWNYELPFGRGKLVGRNAPRWANQMIGGWRFSGTGTVVSSWFALPANNWGTMNKFEVYGQKYPILDCRSTPATAKTPQDERCFNGYLYFNGYISNRFINSRNANGMRNGVFGLPSDYTPAQLPIVPWPVNGQTTDAGASNYDTNNVNVKLTNGSSVLVAVDNGLHPWRQQYRLGPFNWTADASLLKVFNFTESGRVKMRLNVDLFNIFNVQGLNTPAADGVVTLQNSYGGFGIRPRQMQVTARFEW